jgi:hypothetical protein
MTPPGPVRSRKVGQNQFSGGVDNALQLLTDEHLRHVTDLSRWNVEQVAPGRYLVEAVNLDDWFAPGGPPDSVVRQARADFGDVIIPADGLDGLL